jgi:hypothetical protein
VSLDDDLRAAGAALKSGDFPHAAHHLAGAVAAAPQAKEVLALLELVVQPDCDLLFSGVCLQVRKLGDRKRALALAEDRVATRPSCHAHVALAGALKALGDDEAAVEAQRGALQYKSEIMPS